jgi:hypothetical protein
MHAWSSVHRSIHSLSVPPRLLELASPSLLSCTEPSCFYARCARHCTVQKACIRYGALELAMSALVRFNHVAVALSTTRMIYSICHQDPSCHEVWVVTVKPDDLITASTTMPILSCL